MGKTIAEQKTITSLAPRAFGAVAPLHLVTRRDAANPAAVRFAQAVLAFASPGAQGDEAADGATR